jgi:mannose-6-phosphate isomerase
MLYPLTFRPIFKERVWGGRELEKLYAKPLPPEVPIGESWEISDRPGDVSVIANGPLAGMDLHWLLHEHADELLGRPISRRERFPLLIKILDAQQKLSLQVHPPPGKAEELGGEPKTEMWYIADAAPSAELYVGLKRWVSRREFERRIQAGTVSDCFHRLPVKAGDAMFLPSGRVHGIGAGLVIFEIQQNSDTTYRVFDWNRAGLDGKPRALHVAESLASIDFDDFEPGLVDHRVEKCGPLQYRFLVRHPLFEVDLCSAEARGSIMLAQGNMSILGLVQGRIVVTDGRNSVELSSGQFCLVPSSIRAEVYFDAATEFLSIQLGTS